MTKIDLEKLPRSIEEINQEIKRREELPKNLLTYNLDGEVLLSKKYF